MTTARTRRSLVALVLALGVATSATPAVAAPSTPSDAPSAVPSAIPSATPTPSAPAVQQLPTVATIPVAPVTPFSADFSSSVGILGVGGAEMQALADRYSSLSGALVWYYAGQQGLSVGDYLKTNPTQAASLLGLQDPQQLEALPEDLGKDEEGAADLGALNRQLNAAGLTLDSRNYDDLDEYGTAVASKANSIDAAVISAGATWAQQLGALRTPALTNPTAPGVNGTPATSMPKEGLIFGMFLDRSLTALVSDHPNIFAQVQSSGLGTPESQQAWRSSMQKALAGSQADFSSMLPSQSGAALLSAMASGDPQAAAKLGISGQSSCVSAGLYLNSQMARLFSPQTASTLPNSNDSLLSPSEYGNLQDWQKKLLEQQNPNLSTSLQQSLGGGSGPTGCGAASSATSGALGVTLPGVFANLTR